MEITRKIPAILMVFAILSLTLGFQQLFAVPQSTPEDREIVFGALLTNADVWSTLGQASQATLQLAVEDVNAYLDQTGSNTRVRIVIEDTGGDPAVALEKLQSFDGQGVRIVIGPETSAEVAAIKPYADEYGILVVSQSSTAGTLALPDDNVFRFTPDDSLEGQATAALMWEDGVKATVPMWRGDAGNEGLYTATKGSFEALGGTVLDGVRYDADTDDFSAALAELSSQAQQAIDQNGTGGVALYLAAFDEAVAIFEQAQNDPVLSSLKWYGSDGIAQSQAIVNNATAAQFAVKTGLPSPILGLDERARERWEPVSQRVTAVIGRVPDAFALSTYDALWVATLAYLTSGDAPSSDNLRTAFTQTASSYYGVTEWTILNEAGDRKFGNLDFWAVRQVDDTFNWVRVARYEQEPGIPGKVIRFQ